MFDATKGQQAANTRLNDLSDQIAADAVSFLDNPGIPRAQKEAAMAAAAAIFADPDSLSQLAQGVYTQVSPAGQPAARALGAGKMTGAQEGLQAILNDSSVDTGVKSLLKRALVPTDPDYLPVDWQGTPTELVNTKRELDTVKTKLAAAENELSATNEDLKKERNKKAAGSFDETAARSALTKVDEAIDSLIGRWGGKVDGIVELKRELNALLREVHLSRA